MRVTAEDYEPLKAFFTWMMSHEVRMPASLTAEEHPLAVLDRFERKSSSIARQSLGLGIGDLIEDSEDYSPERVRRIDDLLAAAGLMTLSEVRARFWTKVQSIMRRNGIRSEGEYYALRNVVDAMVGEDQAKAWRLLDDFEKRLVPAARAREA